jgi:peptide/nickel transport system substrate-binding protein
LKGIISGIMLTFLLMGMLTLAFSIQSSSASTRSLNTSNQIALEYEATGDTKTKPYGGTLRVGFSSGALPGILNPLLDWNSAAMGGAVEISSNMFSRLVRINETGFIVSDLAESWEVSPDNCNYTFRLFQNVTWHDGFKFNASDVKFTYDTILTNPDVEGIWRDLLQECNISSISIIDEYTVNIMLHQPKASFLSVIGLLPIIPWHLYYGTDLAENPFNDRPIGTGPFKFLTWNPGVNITLIANERYHRGRPYLDEVSIAALYDKSLPDLLLNNSIDMVPNCVDPNKIEELSQVTGVTILNSEQPLFEMIHLNFSNPILNDVRVRKALAYAINQSEVCNVGYLGYATPSRGPISPAWSYWYNPNVTTYEYNPTLAEELLDEAGYPRNNQTNIRFSLIFGALWGTRNTPWAWKILTMIRDYWQDIGVNITFRFGLPWEFVNDCFTSGWYPTINDPDDLSYLYHTKSSQYPWSSYNYSNATVDYLLDQGRATFNQTVRKQIYDELQRVLSEDLPTIFLWHPNMVTAYNNDFHGFIKYGFYGAMTPFVLEKVWYEPTLSGKGNCPYRMCFADSEGRRTGYFNGTVYESISDSIYSGVDSDPQVVKIREPSGVYTVELVGVENGSYEVEFVNIALDYKNVWIPQGFIHENETITYMVKVFEDGSMKVYEYDKFSEHDLGIRSTTVSKTVVGQGYAMNLKATVYNWGNSTENSRVTFYANTTVIGTITQVVFLSGKPTNLTFAWNTTALAKGNYTIWAYAWPVQGESDLADNNCTGGSVQITKVGDLGGGSPVPQFFKCDGACNQQDIPLFLQCYRQTAPADAMYLGDLGSGVPVPQFFECDGRVDSADIALFLRCYRGQGP